EVGQAGPGRAGIGRPHEGHAGAPVGAVAELALPGDGLEQRAPSGTESLADLLEAGSRRDGADELLAGEGATFQGRRHDLAEDIDALRAHAEGALPAGPSPGSRVGDEREEGSTLSRL